MEISVSARHVELPDSLRQEAVEKVSKLSRFLDGMSRAEVHFTEKGNPRIPERHVCEVVLEGHGHHVRAKVAAADGSTAVDKAVAKLEKQLRKLKTKLQRREKGRTAAEAVAALPDADERRIVKFKRHELHPMTPDEAALRLDLLGHDFYVFHNSETGRSAVVYRRRDGDLGLIDTAD